MVICASLSLTLRLMPTQRKFLSISLRELIKQEQKKAKTTEEEKKAARANLIRKHNILYAGRENSRKIGKINKLSQAKVEIEIHKLFLNGVACAGCCFAKDSKSLPRDLKYDDFADGEEEKESESFSMRENFCGRFLEKLVPDISLNQQRRCEAFVGWRVGKFFFSVLGGLSF